MLVHNCPQLPPIVVILLRKFPLERGPKRPHKCTIVGDCVQIAESGFKPPFAKPPLNFPELREKKMADSLGQVRHLSFTPGAAWITSVIQKMLSVSVFWPNYSQLQQNDLNNYFQAKSVKKIT